MSKVLGLTLLAMALPAGAAVDAVSVQYHGDNGSLPPPHRRSTEIVVDAAGHGMLTRVHGYDRNDPAQRFERSFTVSPRQREIFARRLDELGLWTTRWRERERVPVGGPLVHVGFRRGEQSVSLPAFPLASQQDAVEALRAEVLALVPAAVSAARQAWEQAKPDSD
jgi:hypothetical protein